MKLHKMFGIKYFSNVKVAFLFCFSLPKLAIIVTGGY